jgi:hypothetical protein
MKKMLTLITGITMICCFISCEKEAPDEIDQTRLEEAISGTWWGNYGTDLTMKNEWGFKLKNDQTISVVTGTPDSCVEIMKGSWFVNMPDSVFANLDSMGVKITLRARLVPETKKMAGKYSNPSCDGYFSMSMK